MLNSSTVGFHFLHFPCCLMPSSGVGEATFYIFASPDARIERRGVSQQIPPVQLGSHREAGRGGTSVGNSCTGTWDVGIGGGVGSSALAIDDRARPLS